MMTRLWPCLVLLALLALMAAAPALATERVPGAVRGARPPLPRIEKHISGYDRHIPLVECVQGPKGYCNISSGYRRVARQIIAACPRPHDHRQLTSADLARLRIPAPDGILDRRAWIGCKIKIATLLAAVARDTNRRGIEWGADLVRDTAGKLSYAIGRGAVNTAFIMEGKTTPLTTVGVISHNHPDGTPEPSFGDLQAMSRVRQAAKRHGLQPHNDEVIVVNVPGKDQFKLVRYEHAFRD
jgi:hypothetical protein